jgi:adenylate kinase/UMP-CMP kinase
VHLSAGDLLRAEVQSGSEVGKACNALMVEGKLVPVSVTIQLLKNAMITSGGSFFLIDGFPRWGRGVGSCMMWHPA